MRKKSTPSKAPLPGQTGLFSFGFSKKKEEATTAAVVVLEDESSKPASSPVKTAHQAAVAVTPKANTLLTQASSLLTQASSLPPPTLQTPSTINTTNKVTTPVPANKKRKIVVDSDDEEEEYEPPSAKTTPVCSGSNNNKRTVLSDFSSASSSEEEEEEEQASSASKKRTSKAKRVVPASPEPTTTAAAKAGVLAPGEHEHNHLPWLQPDTRRDAAMQPMSSPTYNAATLFVPPGYLAGQASFHHKNARKITDAIRVWWEFYSQNADCVLFYKVGKFYELYHACADVGVKHCDLLYMRGDVAHCGFPETAWAKNMSKLVSLNYRVCRIEQTETPAECALRTGKKTGMVRREICQVVSPGTLTYQVRDEFAGMIESTRHGLLALSENLETRRMAVCLVDAATGKFRLGEFDLDEHCIALRSLLAFENVVEIAYCPSKLSSHTLQVLRQETKPLHSPVQAALAFEPYFDQAHIPEVLRNASADEGNALGYCLAVLKRALIDEELVTMQDFSRYHVTTEQQAPSANASAVVVEHMRLDNQALLHLELLTNSHDGTSAGSLLEYLNRTKSRFGARLLREWVCRPLANKPALLARQTRVTALMRLLDSPAVTEFRKALGACPDLERALSRIHALGLKKRASHPDSRAVIYCAAELNKAKIDAFCQTLTALHALRLAGGKLAQAFSDEERTGAFAELCSELTSDASLRGLEHFERAFDAKQAKKLGAIEPRPGVAPDFDAAQAELEAGKQALAQYLDASAKELGVSKLAYFIAKTGKARYQLEVAEAKQVPAHWKLASSTKREKRYVTARLTQLESELVRAEEALAQASTDVSRQVFAEFDKQRAVWSGLVRASAELDCLLSLAFVSSSGSMTLPKFVDADSASAHMEIEAGVHPCVAMALERAGKREFISNDLQLTKQSGLLLLLTGPNMGGKSTLLRQTCLLSIMAQIGAYVPAARYEATIVDAVFTRIGASDRILQGQSTFFVELSETANILAHATNQSLVILDELGRGTSSFDGTAIAHSVVERLVEIGARTLFATHYHSLVRECSAALRGRVQLAHMRCDATGGENAEGDSVLFLYKLAPGCSDRSYGLNVARLAKLPESVIQRAKQRSMQFESDFDAHMRTRLLEEIAQSCERGDAATLRSLLQRAKGY